MMLQRSARNGVPVQKLEMNSFLLTPQQSDGFLVSTKRPMAETIREENKPYASRYVN
ncbi:MAG: hypothetical protein ACT7A5_07205 [Ferrovibrionaceae bacterium]